MMPPLHKFFTIWNRFPLYPTFILNTSKRTVQCRASRRNECFCVIIFTLKILIILYIHSGYGDLESVLLRYSSICVIGVSLHSILILYGHKEDLEKNLTNLYILGEELSRDGIRDTIKITILNVIFQIVLYFLMLFAEILIAHDGFLIDWLDYMIVYSSFLFDVLFQMFYFTMTLKRLILMKNFLHVCENNIELENMRAIERFWLELNKNAQDFLDVFTGPIITRNGLSTICILLDIYTAFENYFLLNDSYNFLALGMLLCADSLIQFSQVSIFILSGMGLADKSKETVEVINDKQRKIGRNNLPYKSMELFLLNSKLNHLDVSVGGFFPLNWTLIYSMVSCISTYLVYLIQFREVEMQKKSD